MIQPQVLVSNMVDISVCMVSLNCLGVLKDCLGSLYATQPSISFEIILVDNASTDGTVDFVRNHYPQIRVIENTRNVGFTKATNQAIAASSGRYLLWLNTDTILEPDSLVKLHDFMQAHPQAGIVGPKVLNRDGSFQPQCKRGLPTPLASLCYMLRVDRVFPNSRWAGQYLLTYLPIDTANRVDAVSGCCLLARRNVWDQIGPLDEHIFAFGEDVDWCVRADNAGWEVWYYPASIITHLKGQGGVHSKPYHKAWGMHHGMWVFYRKHLLAHYSWAVTSLVWLGIWTKLGCTSVLIWMQRTVRPWLQRMIQAAR
ncbi:MAG: glycosyltransferase family 2 protein [Chloroflexota bacterium]|nr:glycosyltransferase family 2 protein [Chloroflexota bacterium]